MLLSGKLDNSKQNLERGCETVPMLRQEIKVGFLRREYKRRDTETHVKIESLVEL